MSRRLRVDIDLESDGVVRDVAPVRVADLGPGHVAEDAPGAFLGEYAGVDPVGELILAPRVQYPQVNRGEAIPECVLLLQTASDGEEEAEAAILCRKVLNVWLREGFQAYRFSDSRRNLDPPRKVPHEVRLRQHRVLDGGDVVHLELECGLAPRLVHVQPPRHLQDVTCVDYKES